MLLVSVKTSDYHQPPRLNNVENSSPDHCTCTSSKTRRPQLGSAVTEGWSQARQLNVYENDNSSDHCTSIKPTTRISCWSQARPATATGGHDGSPQLSTGSLAVIQYDHQSYQALTKDTNTHKNAQIRAKYK